MRYLDLLTALFATVLLTSNLASTKVVALGPFTFDGGTLLFPLAYILGDVLTEVYGYRKSRRVIWIGFLTLLLATLTFQMVAALPAPEGTEAYGEAFTLLLGLAPRIVLGSLLAYLVGEFANAYLLAKLKVRTEGRHFWFRALLSTLVGQGLDTAIFLLVAFYGVWPGELLLAVFVSNYLFKVGVEVLLLPLTYKAVGFLKRTEGVDVYDRDTDFNPFRLA
ncbi:queuosine precursor transporter [Thermus thermamylovorans]|uniref:Probable queuosine precursor transporter n=1 Tax=Thermus thermamylovorans TaxID=2509362 RepID=A0A4V2IUK2_9DEIN|nr:queuosine precursor transporter [Thermus thermamylovorans]TBH17496.1 VUT family protein [Thermus thermamylovorans]